MNYLKYLDHRAKRDDDRLTEELLPAAPAREEELSAVGGGAIFRRGGVVTGSGLYILAGANELFGHTWRGLGRRSSGPRAVSRRQIGRDQGGR